MAGIKIAVVYFSATHVTHAYVEVIWETLLNRGCAVEVFNVTAYASRQNPLALEGFNGVIFGFPVFSDFAPTVINEWLPTLNAKGKKCALFFTYGGRTTGYAHFHTKLLLEQVGFDILFSAEFLGRHSFNIGGWGILPERPNVRDLTLAQEYAALAIERFSQDAPPVLRLQKPFGYNQVISSLANTQEISVRQWKNPIRSGEECSMCRRCETECPTQAFDADAGLSNPRVCIGCMHCVYICPDKALRVDDMKGVYAHFLSNWNVTEEMMNAKQSKIITESWQAAS
jgi:ferredoxin